MVVLIIDQHGIRAFKCEGHAPIAIHPNRPMPIRKRVQLPAWHVHIVGTGGQVKPRQLSFQARRMVRLDSGLAARLEKGLQSFVAECLDHGASV